MSALLLGVNITLDPKRASADCAAAAALGAKVVRTSQEQGWGTVDARLGPFRRACDDHGLLLMQCCQTIGHVQPTTQRALDAYGAFVAECAAMADRTSIGNEINGFGSHEIPDPLKCATTALACIEARNRSTPSSLLLTQSMQPASGALGSVAVEPLLFLRAMLTAAPAILGRHVWLDWHGYCDGRYNPNTQQVWNAAWRTRAVAALLAELGHGVRTITWSEWGTATGPSGNVRAITPTLQAQRFDEQIAEARSQLAAGVHLGDLVWYCLRDRKPASATDWPACAGLLDVNGSPLPVAARFTAAAQMVTR